MDFGKLLSDVETLKTQLEQASQKQDETLGRLETELKDHYNGLQQGVGTLKTQLEQNAIGLQTRLENRIQQNTTEQNAAMDAARKSQLDFANSHREHIESLEQAQSQLRATAEAATQAAQAAAGQTTEQGKAIAELKKNAEEEARSLLQQMANNREATAAKIAELRAGMDRMDASKPIGEMQKRFDVMQADTTRALNSLGGQVESVKNQLEQAKEGQRAINRIREDMERVAKRVDKLEQSLREQDEYIQDLGNQRVFAGGGAAAPVPRRKEKKSPLPLIAVLLSTVAILGMAVGGFLLKQSQDALASQIQQQLLPPQSTMAAQLQDLSTQVEQLKILALATPEPTATPTPTPVPTPAPTEAPTVTPNAEVTPKMN